MSVALRPLALRPPLALHALPFSRIVAGAGAAVLGAVLGLLSAGGSGGGGARGPCDMCGGAGWVAGASGRRRCPRCRGGGTHVHAYRGPQLAPQPIPVRVSDGFHHAAAALLALPAVAARPALRRLRARPHALGPRCALPPRAWRPA